MLRIVSRAPVALKSRWSGKFSVQKRLLVSDSKGDKIEVEVKFPFTKAEEDKIQAISKLISIKRFTDHYFDNNSYTLTSKDIWLRQRDDKWECKTTRLDFEPSSKPENVVS